jgi:hypothetical protein
MKFLTAKYLSIVLLACAFAGTINASRSDDNSYDSSCGSCYECGCNPLYCGAWDLQIQGGVNPILWRNRGQILAVSPVLAPAPTVVVLYNNVPKFNKLFKTPWIVGGQVGYAWSDNTRVYVEFNYSQSKGKNAVVIPTDLAATLSTTYSFGKYKIFDAYAGARYYWDRWCDRVAFFFGGKVGLTHHKRINADLILTNSAVTPATTLSPTAVPQYGSNTVVSGGANVGFDVCFCGNWSFVVTGEVVASCGPRNVNNVVLSATFANLTNILPGSIGTELRFPVTAAIRYSF